MLVNRQRMRNVVTRKVYWYSKMISLLPCLRRKKDPNHQKNMRAARIY